MRNAGRLAGAVVLSGGLLVSEWYSERLPYANPHAEYQPPAPTTAVGVFASGGNNINIAVTDTGIQVVDFSPPGYVPADYSLKIERDRLVVQSSGLLPPIVSAG
jgi:hypothetical protein